MVAGEVEFGSVRGDLEQSGVDLLQPSVSLLLNDATLRRKFVGVGLVPDKVARELDRQWQITNQGLNPELPSYKRRLARLRAIAEIRDGLRGDSGGDLLRRLEVGAVEVESREAQELARTALEAERPQKRWWQVWR